MKKSVWIFLLAVFLPGAVLGWLALRGVEEQQIVFERRTAELYQKETEALASEVRDVIEAQRRDFGDALHRLLARNDPRKLADDFTTSLADVWPRKVIGFALSKDGVMLSPTTKVAASNQDWTNFIWNDGPWLCNAQVARVYVPRQDNNASRYNSGNSLAYQTGGKGQQIYGRGGQEQEPLKDNNYDAAKALTLAKNEPMEQGRQEQRGLDRSTGDVQLQANFKSLPSPQTPVPISGGILGTQAEPTSSGGPPLLQGGVEVNQSQVDRPSAPTRPAAPMPTAAQKIATQGVVTSGAEAKTAPSTAEEIAPTAPVLNPAPAAVGQVTGTVGKSELSAAYGKPANAPITLDPEGRARLRTTTASNALTDAVAPVAPAAPTDVPAPEMPTSTAGVSAYSGGLEGVETLRRSERTTMGRFVNPRSGFATAHKWYYSWGGTLANSDAESLGEDAAGKPATGGFLPPPPADSRRLFGSVDEYGFSRGFQYRGRETGAQIDWAEAQDYALWAVPSVSKLAADTPSDPGATGLGLATAPKSAAPLVESPQPQSPPLPSGATADDKTNEYFSTSNPRSKEGMDPRGGSRNGGIVLTTPVAPAAPMARRSGIDEKLAETEIRKDLLDRNASDGGLRKEKSAVVLGGQSGSPDAGVLTGKIASATGKGKQAQLGMEKDSPDQGMVANNILDPNAAHLVKQIPGPDGSITLRVGPKKIGGGKTGTFQMPAPKPAAEPAPAPVPAAPVAPVAARPVEEEKSSRALDMASLSSTNKGVKDAASLERKMEEPSKDLPARLERKVEAEKLVTPQMVVPSNQQIEQQSQRAWAVAGDATDNNNSVVRNVAPQQVLNSPSQAVSSLIPDTTSFNTITGMSDEGMVARFVQDKLEIIFWVRPPEDRNLVFGCLVEAEALKDILTNLVQQRQPVWDGSKPAYVLALLDDKAKPVAMQPASNNLREWKRPFVASEVGEALPHWETALYLASPEALAESASGFRRTLSFTVAAALAIILIGAWLVVADIRRQLALAQQKTDFVSNVSHELKTPLTSIRMFAELMHDRPPPAEKQGQYLRIITVEAERLTRLINNVLDFAKLERRQKRFDKRTLDLHAVITRVWDCHEMHLRDAGFTTRWQAAPAPYPVLGDEDALSQVLVNLLSNAEKYSPERKEVELHTWLEDGWLHVSVLDRGMGVPNGEERKIFESFYRAHDSLSSGIQGSGLGLTLAVRLAEEHGGRVEYSRREGGGSRFTLLVPLAETPEPELS